MRPQVSFPDCAQYWNIDPSSETDADVFMSNWNWDAKALDFGSGPAVCMQGFHTLPCNVVTVAPDLRSQLDDPQGPQGVWLTLHVTQEQFQELQAVQTAF